MTMHYTSKEETWHDENAKAGAMNAIELFMCSDGNYRDRDAKLAYEALRLQELYLPVPRK